MAAQALTPRSQAHLQLRHLLSMAEEPLPSPTAEKLELARRATLCPTERADAISYDWAFIGLGVVFAGGAYPIVLAAILTMFAAVAFLWSALNNYSTGIRLEELPQILVSVLGFCMIGGTIGILWSGFVAVLTLPIAYLVTWSLNLKTSIIRVGAFAGGLVGFICVLPLTLSVPWLNFGGDVWQVVLMVLLGPMLATILGQLGGAWGGRKSRAAGPPRDWQKAILAGALLKTVARDTADGFHGNPPRLQFGIRHLLWVSVWLSLLLALIRASGIPFELILPLLVGWLAFQSFTLWFGKRLLPRLTRWRESHRQARST